MIWQFGGIKLFGPEDGRYETRWPEAFPGWFSARADAWIMIQHCHTCIAAIEQDPESMLIYGPSVLDDLRRVIAHLQSELDRQADAQREAVSQFQKAHPRR